MKNLSLYSWPEPAIVSGMTRPSSGLGIPAATSLVVANMVGTGVFAALHYQLYDFRSAPAILLLWLAGGLVAICGALSYASLARQLPQSGGEYHFLGAIYHPALGFMAGMLSAIIGFGVPTAITAILLGGYLARALPWVQPQVAASVVILLGAVSHGLSARVSGRVQFFSTVLKLALIAVFLVAAAATPGHGDIRWHPDPADDWAQIARPAFATAMFYVFYSYSGWNAAVYGLEEWRHRERTVRLSLVIGTLLVTALYLGLNAAFLKAAPVAALSASEEVGHVAATALFGQAAGRWVSGLLAIGLFASVSALLWAGPRVLGTMARQLPALRFLVSHGEVPKRALAFQTVLALILVWPGKLDFLITYTQSGLSLCTLLTVLGLLILKARGRDIRWKAWAPALIFVSFMGFVMVFLFYDKPLAAGCGIATAACCALLWFPLHRKSS